MENTPGPSETPTPSSSLSPTSSETELLSFCGIELLDKAVNNFKLTGKMSQDDLLCLHYTFGPLILSAFELIDNERVQGFKSPSERYIVRISGSRGDHYWIPAGSRLCQCESFRWKNELCKHILASHFYLALKTPEDEYELITDEELDELYIDNLSKDE